jgi:predicted alpha/beta superfamily hydrolase
LSVIIKMKKKILGAVALILITFGVTYIILHDHFTGRFPWRPPHSEGAIQTKIHSNVLGEDRDVIIHFPPGYDSTATYPVMYVLDGSSVDNHIAEKFDVLSAAEYTPKTIVVGIPNMTAENRQQNLTPPFMKIDAEDNASPLGRADRFLLFMESELFPFMEKNYGASPVRLFTGNSRGGLLVMYSLLHKPDLFQARFCYSTPFWRQDYILVSKVSDFLSSTDTLSTFLFMSAGANETENIKNGLGRMTKAFQEKAPIGLIWHSVYTPNAVHQNNLRISAAVGIRRWSEYIKR